MVTVSCLNALGRDESMPEIPFTSDGALAIHIPAARSLGSGFLEYMNGGTVSAYPKCVLEYIPEDGGRAPRLTA